MRRAVAAFTLFLLSAIGLDGHDEALAGWFDLRVYGGAATLAALGIPPEERALTLPITARAIHDHNTRIRISPGRLAQILSLLSVAAAAPAAQADSMAIPAPLDEDTWRQLLSLKPTDDLFARLLTDRSALLLAAGLMATDGSVRRLVARDRDLLRFLYQDAAAVFSIVARRLRVEDGGMVVPGGDGAEDIWRRLTGSSPSQPEVFMRALLTRDTGRLAWYFDTIAGMESGRLAVAWPSATGEARFEDALALYATFRDSEPLWQAPDSPYRRRFGDAWSVAMLPDIADGLLAGPSSAAFWQFVFSQNPRGRASSSKSAPALSMAHLAQTVLRGTPRKRRDKFEVFRLAQRVFPHPPASDLPAIAEALSAYGEYPALLLALERMHVTNPQTWMTIVNAAQFATSHSDAARNSIAAFQAAVSLVERIRHVRGIDASTADSALQALGTGVRRHSRVTRSIAEWIKTSFVPALPPLERPDAWTRRTAYESTIIQALAGPRALSTPSIVWEGLTYKVDVVAAEHQRLRAVRAQVPSPGLDAALSSNDDKAIVAALMALVYTSALGEPDGAVALSRDVATRHDLGFNASPQIRAERLWTPPEERQDSGPWRVLGSLISLDLGLSRLALRRLANQLMPTAPTLTLNDFGTMTRTVVAMVPSELADTDRDELARALARGRQRVADAGLAVPALDALANEAGVSEVSRQLLPWIVSRDPASVAQIFSLRDVMWLGRPALAQHQLDRWGVAADGLDGRRITAMPGPAPWEDFSGRPDAGQMATQVPDLTLRLVEETARLRVPAVLIPSLLAFAVQDHWHEVQARFGDDWLCMTRHARNLDATRIEDYVAALTGTGPLRAQ